MIILVSCFRDSTSYLDRYANQVQALRTLVAPESVYVIAVEGDSADDTYHDLLHDQTFDEVLRAEHGGPKFGSVIHPLRWRQLSVAGNAGLCAAQRVSRLGDRTVYVESDLIWDAQTILCLAANLAEVPACATMSMAGARFYDIWGHTKDGRGFSAHPPYYPGWEAGATGLVQIDTAGSCFALAHDALQTTEFSAVDCIHGIGRSLYAHGYALFLDPSLRVEHPT